MQTKYEQVLKRYFTTVFLAIIFLVLVIIFGAGYLGDTSKGIPKIVEIIVQSAFASLLAVWLIELSQKTRDNENFGYLAGEYQRSGDHIFHKNSKTSGIKYDTIDYSNVGKSFKIKHLGDGKYLIDKIEYEIGTQTIEFYIDKFNKNYLKGTYKYIHKKNKDDKETDLGVVEMFVIENKIYNYYKNIVPNGNVEGYEIWEKVNKRNTN